MRPLHKMLGRVFPTRLRAKLSRAVPLWNKTVSRVVVVEMRRPTFLLMTTHRDSRIYKKKQNKVKVNRSALAK